MFFWTVKQQSYDYYHLTLGIRLPNVKGKVYRVSIHLVFTIQINPVFWCLKSLNLRLPVSFSGLRRDGKSWMLGRDFSQMFPGKIWFLGNGVWKCRPLKYNIQKISLILSYEGNESTFGLQKHNIIKILNINIMLSCTHLYHFIPVSIHYLQCITLYVTEYW